MDHDDSARAVAMRVRILFRGTPVGRPARVADSVSAVEGTEPNRFFEVAQFSFRASNLEIVIFIYDGDAGGVVAAILEFAQPVDDERDDLYVANVTHNSTHAC